MLTVRYPVHFPQLVFDKEIAFPTNSSKTFLFKLDWTKFDEYHKKEHSKWNKEYKPQMQVPYLSVVPVEIQSILDDMHFALDGKYISEINRCFRQAFEEWQIKKPFDTVIVDATMDIQKAYVFVGFKLLCDCMFNEKKFYYERGIIKRIAPHAMAARFWQQYVGTGRIQEFAETDKLSTLLSVKQLGTDAIVIEKFLSDLNNRIMNEEITSAVYINELDDCDTEKRLADIHKQFLMNGDLSETEPCCSNDHNGDGDCHIHKKKNAKSTR